MVCIRVPGTSANLGPGFDALALALSIYNYVEVEAGPAVNLPLKIEVQGEGAADLAQDEKNLVFKALKNAFDYRGQAIPALSLRLVNNIPIARGLGSSAAAIVGGLVAANQLLNLPLEQEEMLELATKMEGHPDNVSAALLGGLVISCSAEDKTHYFKTQFPAGVKSVVAVPEFRVSTKEARDVLPKSLSREQAVFNLSRTALLTAGLLTNDLSVLSVALDDKLHQPYRSSLVPGMPAVFTAAKEAGALGVALSGAGPSVIAFTKDNALAIEAAMKRAFQDHGVEAQTIITTPTAQGAEVLPELRVCTA
ncbi:MAG: homoserine kinase [bacterium]|jgi:homoserine kinase